MISKKMRNLWLGIILVTIFVTPSWSEEKPAECKECAGTIDGCLELVTEFISGSTKFDPFHMENIEVCQGVILHNIKTLKRGGEKKETCFKPCKEPGKEECFIQYVKLEFTGLNVTCKIGDFQFVSELMFKKAGIPCPKWPTISIPSFTAVKGWFGSKATDPPPTTPAPVSTDVYLDWAKASIVLEMEMCPDANKYEVRKVTFKGEGEKCWCGGGTLVGKICGLMTGLDVFKKIIGKVSGFIIQMVMPLIVKELPHNVITMLNCEE